MYAEKSRRILLGLGKVLTSATLLFPAVARPQSQPLAHRLPSGLRQLREVTGRDQKVVRERVGRIPSGDTQLLGFALGKTTVKQVRASLGPAENLSQGFAEFVDTFCYAAGSADGTRLAFGVWNGGLQSPPKITTIAVAAQGARTKWTGQCTRSNAVSRRLATDSGLRLGLTPREVSGLLGPPTRTAGDLLEWQWSALKQSKRYDDPLRYEGIVRIQFAAGKAVYLEVGEHQTGGRMPAAYLTILGFTAGKTPLPQILGRLGDAPIFYLGPPAIWGSCYVASDGTRLALEQWGDMKTGPPDGFAVAAKGARTGWKGPCPASSAVSRGLATEGGLKLGLTLPRLVALFGEPTRRSGNKLTWEWDAFEPVPPTVGDECYGGYYPVSGTIQVRMLQERVVYFEVFETGSC